MSETFPVRVCSHNASHDLTEADPWSKVCPICGANIVELPPPTPVPTPAPTPTPRPPEPTPEPTPPPEEKAVVEEAVEPDRPVRPPPALICAKVPGHDITRRTPDAIVCPHPHCGGALIQLECESDLTHDVSRRAPDQFTCPVCGGPLVTPVCTFDRTHSMVHRAAGQTACPIETCGHEVKRVVYQHPPIDGGIEIKVETFWQRLLAWLQRLHLWLLMYRRLVAATIAAIVALAGIAVVVYVVWPDHPHNPCDAIPKDSRQAVEAVGKRLAAGISAADASAMAQVHLRCKSPEPALLLLRRAYDEGDAEAARTLGQMFDPTAPADTLGRQKSDEARAVGWYARAVKAGSQPARADLQRLATALKSERNNVDPERDALIDLAQDALGGSAK